MTLPYLPSGSAFLPATRFILFADDSHRIHKIDESQKTLSGTSFTGHWESGSLNQDNLVAETINLLTIVYSSPVNTTITVKVSGDGGVTWSESKTITISQTSGDEIARVRQGFNTSGFDVRFRLELDTDQVINIYELHPELVVRGEHVI